MRVVSAFLLAFAFALAAGTSPLAAQFGPRRQGGERPAPPIASVEAPACVSVRAESRPDGTGYTHLLVLQNLCGSAVVCDVGTDAGETPVHVVLPPQTSEEVVVRRSSPAPIVAARGRCVEARR